MRLATPAVVVCLAAITPTAPAFAGIATSGDCVQTPRSISVSSAVAAQCVAAGRGGLRGAGDAFRADHLGWVQLDSSDPAVRTVNAGWLSGELSGTAGSFAVDAAAWAAYDHLVVGFQTGGSRSDPDWVVFELADMTLGGQWAISAQTVGHVVLYGMNEPMPNIVDIPEPTSVALAGVALAGLGITRRRQQKRG